MFLDLLATHEFGMNITFNTVKSFCTKYTNKKKHRVIQDKSERAKTMNESIHSFCLEICFDCLFIFCSFFFEKKVSIV